MQYVYLNIKQLDALNFIMNYFMPLHVSSTCAHRQAKLVLYSLWYHHTYRPPIGVMIPETV